MGYVFILGHALEGEAYLPRKSRILERILSFVGPFWLAVLEHSAKLLEWFLNRYLHYIHDWTAG